MLQSIPQKLSWKNSFLIFFIAFVLRAGTFYVYVQHQERYCQSDSMDYHICSFCVAHDFGMHRPDTGRPIFWRTPGYPWFLSFFYTLWGNHQTADFAQHAPAHKAAIWFQIFISSCVPLLIFLLALQLTHSYFIAWASAIISIFHLGFILASTYLLTDALALIFFLGFLIFYFRTNLVLAALCLSAYTWMRPMGQFVALVALIMLLFAHVGWRKKLFNIILFGALFFGTIFPWFVRNHELTGKWFFCPLFGLYFNVFNAPKILSRINNIPLREAHTQLTQAAGHRTAQVTTEYRMSGNPKIVCGELVCLETAWPLIKAHPGYFLYDWCVEVCKTTFDLYSSQLVAFAGNCFKWDPLVEYLDEKFKACLYKEPLPIWMRVIAWLELVFSIWLWFGIFAGTWFFMIKPLINFKNIIPHERNTLFLWLQLGILIGCVVFQTGGFGYARLRLPIEALLIILALTFWHKKVLT